MSQSPPFGVGLTTDRGNSLLTPPDAGLAGTEHWGHGGMATRLFDVVFSLVAVFMLLPVWLLIAVAIKLDDGGPVFYCHERIGRYGRRFRLRKLRTMRVGSDRHWAPMVRDYSGRALFFKVRDDPRVTRVGWFLRRFSLDETPQFLDVLAGKMSVVGPRPHVAAEVAEYEPGQLRRLSVKPGITGLWQVSGRSELSAEEGMALDLRYVDSRSFPTDLHIVARTAKAVVTGKGAW